MVTDELIKYIELQKSRGVSQEAVMSKLISAGWKESDAKEGIDTVFSVSAPLATQYPIMDPYREKVSDEVVQQVKPAASILSEPVISSSETPIQNSVQVPENFIPNLASKKEVINNPLPVNNTVPVYSSISNPNIEYKGMPTNSMLSSFSRDYKLAEMNNPQSTSGGFKKFLVTFFIVAIILGGGWFAYRSGAINSISKVLGSMSLPFDLPFLKVSKEKVFAKAIENMSSLNSYHVSTDVTMKSTQGEQTHSAQVSVESDIEKTTDGQDVSNKITVNSSMLESFLGTDSTEIETRMLKDSMYIKSELVAQLINTFASDPETATPLIASDTWIVLSRGDEEVFGVLPSHIKAQITRGLTLQGDKAKQEQIKTLFKNFFVTYVTEDGTETVEGIEMRKYQFVFSKNALFGLLTQINSISNMLTVEEIESVEDFLPESVSGSIWVDKKEYLFKKIQLGFNASQASTTASVNATINFSDENQAVSISAPLNPMKLEDIFPVPAEESEPVAETTPIVVPEKEVVLAELEQVMREVTICEYEKGLASVPASTAVVCVKDLKTNTAFTGHSKVWPTLPIGWTYGKPTGALSTNNYAYSAMKGQQKVTCTFNDLTCK